MKSKQLKRNYSTHPRFVPWPPSMLERIKNGDPTPEDPVVIAVYFQLYLYKHFSDYRAFFLDCLQTMGPKLKDYQNKDLPPFVPQLIDEVFPGLTEPSLKGGPL